MVIICTPAEAAVAASPVGTWLSAITWGATAPSCGFTPSIAVGDARMGSLVAVEMICGLRMAPPAAARLVGR